MLDSDSTEGVNKSRSILTGYADEILANLDEAETPHDSDAVLRSRNGRGLLLISFPIPPEDIPCLTDCDRDCLALLAQMEEPLSAEGVRIALKRQGRPAYPTITVKRSLSKLTQRGLVANRKRAPRGDTGDLDVVEMLWINYDPDKDAPFRRNNTR